MGIFTLKLFTKQWPLIVPPPPPQKKKFPLRIVLTWHNLIIWMSTTGVTHREAQHPDPSRVLGTTCMSTTPTPAMPILPSLWQHCPPQLRHNDPVNNRPVTLTSFQHNSWTQPLKKLLCGWKPQVWVVCCMSVVPLVSLQHRNTNNSPYAISLSP